MYVVGFLVRKKAGMSQAEFSRYWIEEHTPLTAKVPGLRSYRCFPFTGYPDAEPPYDAVAFITFDDEAAWQVARDSPELATAIADAPNFQTTEETITFYADEHVIV